VTAAWSTPWFFTYARPYVPKASRMSRSEGPGDRSWDPVQSFREIVCRHDASDLHVAGGTGWHSLVAAKWLKSRESNRHGTCCAGRSEDPSFSLVPPQPWPPGSRVLRARTDGAAPIATAKSSITREPCADAHARRADDVAQGQAAFAGSRGSTSGRERRRRTTTSSCRAQRIDRGSAWLTPARAERRRARCARRFISRSRTSASHGLRLPRSRAREPRQGVSNPDAKPFPPLGRQFDLGSARLPIRSPFLDTLALDYGAGMNLVDFKTNPTARRTRGSTSGPRTRRRGVIKDIARAP